MSKIRFAAPALFLGAAILGTTARARAFDYLEHEHISRRAIDLAIQACARSGSCAPAPHGDEPRRTGAEVMASVLKALDSKVLREGTPVTDKHTTRYRPRISDVPALAGDYAASPLLVKWRWFNDCQGDRTPAALLMQLPKIIGAYSLAEQSPEQAAQSNPNMVGLLRLVRPYDALRWPLKKDQLPSDLTFAKLDDSYGTLGERGHPHFRPRLQAPSAELASQRRYYDWGGEHRIKPADQAYAWYADLHLGALEYAATAYQARLDPQRRSFFEGVAMLLELSALHYLEDSIAAGHMATGVPPGMSVLGGSSRWLKNGSTQATHDHYGREGIQATPGTELCTNLKKRGWSSDLNELERVCGGASGPVRVTLVGDSALDTKAPGSVTEDWAVAVVAESVREVLEAALGGARPPLRAELGRCDTTDFTSAPSKDEGYTWTNHEMTCDGEPKQQHASEQPLYRCLFQWWERDNLGPDALDHEKAIREAYPESYFAALRMVPVPEGCTAASSSREECEAKYPVYQDFAGAGFVLEASQEYSFATKGNFLGLAGGVTLGLPKNMFPLQLILRGEYAFGGGSGLAGAEFGVRWYPCHHPCESPQGPFIGLHGRLGRLFNDGSGTGEWKGIGGGTLEAGFRVFNHDDSTFSMGAQLGIATALGASLGARLALVYR